MPEDYVSYFRSDPRHTASGPATPGLALIGGPPEGPPPEVDAAFTWLFAKSGWGRFVVIGADGEEEYGRYIYDHLPAPHPISVATLIFKTRDAASNPTVVETIRHADALFIQGGDQWDYIRLWKDTPVEQAIAQVITRGAPIGGSSAGLAVLGEFVFSARNGTVYSSEALADPRVKTAGATALGQVAGKIDRVARVHIYAPGVQAAVVALGRVAFDAYLSILTRDPAA